MKFSYLAAFAVAVGMGGSAHANDTTCTALSDYVAPPVGATFTYEVLHRGEAIPVWIRRTVTAAEGARVEYTQQFESSDGSRPPSPPRSENVEAGFFPATSGLTLEGDPLRVRTYSRPPADIVAGLEPGDMAEFESSETSSMNNRTRTVTAPARLVFARCDTVEVDGVAEPVRVYDLAYTARTYVAGRQPRADMTAEKSNTVYLSVRYGYPLRIDSATGHVQAISVDLPVEGGEETSGEGG